MTDLQIFGALLAAVLFCGLSLLGIVALRAFHWLLRPGQAAPSAERVEPASYTTSLSQDGRLLKFFSQVDGSFRRNQPTANNSWSVGPTSGYPPKSQNLSSPAEPAPSTPTPLPNADPPERRPYADAQAPVPVWIRPDPVPIRDAPKAHAPRPAFGLPAALPATTPPPDNDLAALLGIWPKLSGRDRQELVALARLKLELSR